jgi:hypothetical protein
MNPVRGPGAYPGVHETEIGVMILDSNGDIVIDDCQPFEGMVTLTAADAALIVAAVNAYPDLIPADDPGDE